MNVDLNNIGWLDFLLICDRFLEKYPEDIFDGSSGDPGPIFIRDLREARKNLDENISDQTR